MEQFTHELYELISLEAMLTKDEILDVFSRVQELRAALSKHVHERYGDLFRLLAAAGLIQLSCWQEDDYFSLTTTSYRGVDDGNSLEFLGEVVSSAGRFCNITSPLADGARVESVLPPTTATAASEHCSGKPQ